MVVLLGTCAGLDPRSHSFDYQASFASVARAESQNCLAQLAVVFTVSPEHIYYQVSTHLNRHSSAAAFITSQSAPAYCFVWRSVRFALHHSHLS